MGGLRSLPPIFVARIISQQNPGLHAATGPVIAGLDQPVVAEILGMPMNNYLWQFEQV